MLFTHLRLTDLTNTHGKVVASCIADAAWSSPAPPLADGRRRGGEPGGRGGIASWEEMSKRGASAGDDEPASKRAKVAPRVPPLLSNRTCKDNPRWLAGHTAEVLDAAGSGADRAAHAFMLVLFEGACEQP